MMQTEKLERAQGYEYLFIVNGELVTVNAGELGRTDCPRELLFAGGWLLNT